MNTTLQRLGRYRLQERLGSSDIAEVWKAFSPQLRRYVAIKILHADLKNDPRFITRFEREAKVIASLHHPNIVQIHDFQGLPIEPADPQGRSPASLSSSVAGSHFQGLPSNTVAYLVMDYIDGSTLADYIGNTSRKENFPSANEIVHLFASICAAIDYAHSKGIIHGDIKPANIVLDTHTLHRDFDHPPDTGAEIVRAGARLIEAPRPHWSDGFIPMGAQSAIGNPIVTDFGMTRLLGTPVATLSRRGLVTPFYLSPKQAMGYVGDVSSDIYSLGSILYEMCTGVPPFQGDNPSAILLQHITAAPIPPIELNPAIPSALSTTILRSLDKNPQMRFPDVSALAEAVAEAFGVPLPDILNSPYQSSKQATSSGDLGMTYVALDSRLHRSQGTATIAKQQHPEDDQLIPIDVTTSHDMPISSLMPSADVLATEEASESTVTSLSPAASWQRSSLSSRRAPFQTPLPPSWPPPAAPPSTPAFPPAPIPSLLELALNRFRGRKPKGVLRDWHLVLLAVLMLVLIVSSLGTLLVLAHRMTSIATQHVGYVYFLSSGQLSMNNNQGIDDEVQIDLHGIAAPHPGKSYYAWLIGDANASEVPWILLGRIRESSGNVHFLYTGDVAHTNLLTDMSRFVITEGDVNAVPNNPLLDTNSWRYYGQIFQSPSPKDMNHFSMLDHIRHLLVQAPELEMLGLQGGLGTWLLHNVEQISQWALNAKEAWGTKNIMLVSRELVNILYYIDGACTSADFAGMPSYMPTTPENASMARIAHFSLINPCPQQQQETANRLKQVLSHTPPDYIDHTLFHLEGVMQSPGTTPIQRALAVSLNTAVNDVKGWLQQVRKDALQLCDMPENQLTQLRALSALSDLEIQARYAYAGETDPASAQVREGVTWIYDNMQRLASIDVTAFP